MDPTERSRSQEIAVAGRLLEIRPGGLNPTDWAELARQAAMIREEAVRDLMVRKTFEQTMMPTRQAAHHLDIDHSARPGGPEIGL